MLTLLMLAVLVIVGWNALACMHAMAMTRFAAAGVATPPPEALGLGGKIKTLILGVRLPRPVNDRTPAALALPYTSVTITQGSDAHLGAWHIASPDADTLVILLHGYCANKSAVLDEAAVFHALGCDSLLVDFPGSGESSGNVTTIGYREAQDVVAMLRYAQRHYPDRRIVLFGQSMGAAAILRSIACDATQPDGIIIEAVFDTMLRTVKNRFDSMGVPHTPSAHLLTFWGGVVMGVNGFKHNPQDYARAVKAPTLVLHGRDDPRARLEDGQRVYDAISAPKSMHVFEGVKHESFQAAQPEAWRAAVARFLQDLRAGD